MQAGIRPPAVKSYTLVGNYKGASKISMNAFTLWISENNIVIFAFLIFVAIILWLLKFEKKLNIQWPEAMAVSLVHVVVGWSCMRLLALAEVGFDSEKAANIRLFGAIFVLPFLYYAWAKKTNRNIALVMDASAICVIIGAISGRLNCLTQGCCQGVPIFFIETAKWPLREIELVFYVIFIFYYFGKIGTKKTHGQVYPMYLISYGILRFLSEFVREEFTTEVGVFHLAHIWALLAIVAGIITLHWVKKRSGTSQLRKGSISLHRKVQEGGT